MTDTTKKLTVLVTGPGGRIGPHLIGPFRERYHLKLLDHKPIPSEPETIIADLSDLSVLKNAMEGVDVVLHLAATSDEAPFIESLVPNNIVGVYNTFQAAHEAGVRRVVFASTVQAVSADKGDHTIQITDPPRPSTMYGATKVFGEVLGRWFHDKHEMEFVGIRIGWFQNYDSPHLLKNGGARSVWLSPRDCAGVMMAAIEKENVGYALVFGTSKTERERLARAPMLEQLDYVPQDDVEVLYPLDAPPA